MTYAEAVKLGLTKDQMIQAGVELPAEQPQAKLVGPGFSKTLTKEEVEEASKVVGKYDLELTSMTASPLADAKFKRTRSNKYVGFHFITSDGQTGWRKADEVVKNGVCDWDEQSNAFVYSGKAVNVINGLPELAQ